MIYGPQDAGAGTRAIVVLSAYVSARNRRWKLASKVAWSKVAKSGDHQIAFDHDLDFVDDDSATHMYLPGAPV